MYRLDQCDEDGTLIDDAPPAYVSIDAHRNAAPSGDGDARDAFIRDLAQINADVSMTIADRFASIMAAASDLLRAADGAGLPHRQGAAPLPSALPNPDEDDDNDEEDDAHLPTTTDRVWAVVEQMLPTIQIWIPKPGPWAPAKPAVGNAPGAG